MDIDIKSIFPTKIRIRRRKRKRGRKLFNGKDPRLVARRIITAFFKGCSDKGIAMCAEISLSAYYRYMRKTRGKKLLWAKEIFRNKTTREKGIGFARLGELKLAHIDLDLSKNNDSEVYGNSR